MSSRSRKEQGRFDLQPGAASRNGHDSKSNAPEVTAEQPRPDVPASVQGTALGKIEVSPKAIAHVASRAAQRSYGVVGLAQRHARPGWAELLRREEAHKGVEVTLDTGQVVIDLYVVIEYGTRISEVARNIMSNVKFAVESALDVKEAQINVNVQDIRVSEDEPKT